MTVVGRRALGVQKHDIFKVRGGMEASCASSRPRIPHVRHECRRTFVVVLRDPLRSGDACVACPCDHEPIRTFVRPYYS
jgi:hypothetical protein